MSGLNYNYVFINDAQSFSTLVWTIFVEGDKFIMLFRLISVQLHFLLGYVSLLFCCVSFHCWLFVKGWLLWSLHALYIIILDVCMCRQTQHYTYVVTFVSEIPHPFLFFDLKWVFNRGKVRCNSHRAGVLTDLVFHQHLVARPTSHSWGLAMHSVLSHRLANKYDYAAENYRYLFHLILKILY